VEVAKLYVSEEIYTFSEYAMPIA